MTAIATTGLDASQRLHSYLRRTHWKDDAVRGPDPGVRFNARIGRFAKSYLHFAPWSDNMAYMQAQAYWIMDNWMMADLLRDELYHKIAYACSKYVLNSQSPEGYWLYPNPEWKDRIATVEGCFATLALVESYAQTGYEPFLEGAEKFYEYLVNGIGFRRQKREGMLAINYLAQDSGDGGGVPNNSTLALWTSARLAEVTGDDNFLTYGAPMVAWLNHVQRPSGELPYDVGKTPGKGLTHFLCYQYNAFEFMDLVHYYRITGDRAIWPVMRRLAGYLAGGFTADAAARYDCHRETPEVIYYTSAVAQALSQATALGMVDVGWIANRAFERVLSQQTPDGGFQFHSRANYRFLSDRRSYPRYLAMILNHLLREAQTQTTAEAQFGGTQA